MKIALPSDDESTIAPRFGRAHGFVTFEVRAGIAKKTGYRLVNYLTTPLVCTREDRSSRHQTILDTLAGCTTVIARRMGAHMYDDLLSCGIDVILTTDHDARAAVDEFIRRAIPERPTLGCEDDS